MTKYKNGQVPASALVKRGPYSLSAATWAKWDALVADVKKVFGITLTITSNPYRDYAAQVAMKEKHGANAAAPGTSSHGGTFKGKDALAIDCSNYLKIGTKNFFAYAQKHGFEVNYFDGKSKPYEPWHIIDWSPWAAVSGGSPAPSPTPTPAEETEMSAIFKSSKDPRIIIDDLGADNIGDYKPSQVSSSDLINATQAVYGEHEVIAQAQLDVAAAFARNRWKAKKAEIVAEVVAALLPEIKKILGK